MNFIHIGLGKAASTSLQLNTFPNLPLFYLGKLGENSQLRTKMISSISQANSFVYDESQLQSELSIDLKKINLISDELFATYTFNDPYIMANRLHALFGQSKILLIIREPSQWLNSQYMFRLTCGREDVFKDHNQWLLECLRNKNVGNPTMQVYYQNLYDIYCQVFGKKNIVVLPFELLRKDKHKFYQELDNYFGFEHGTCLAATPDDKKIEKKRFSAEHLEKIQLFFDLEKNKEDIALLFESPQFRELSWSVDEFAKSQRYRRLIVNTILKQATTNDQSAKVSFNKDKIAAINRYNEKLNQQVSLHLSEDLSLMGYS